MPNLKKQIAVLVLVVVVEMGLFLAMLEYYKRAPGDGTPPPEAVYHGLQVIFFTMCVFPVAVITDQIFKYAKRSQPDRAMRKRASAVIEEHINDRAVAWVERFTTHPRESLVEHAELIRSVGFEAKRFYQASADEEVIAVFPTVSLSNLEGGVMVITDRCMHHQTRLVIGNWTASWDHIRRVEVLGPRVEIEQSDGQVVMYHVDPTLLMTHPLVLTEIFKYAQT